MTFYNYPKRNGSSSSSVTLTGENRAFGSATGTLRVASLLGNATGIADFGSGAFSAQTLRVVIASDQPAIPTTGGGATDFGISSAASRVAALLGNASGIADFGSGVVGAQTLRVVLPTDQSAIPASQSGTWNINNISGTISLPTGAATETTLAALNTKVATQVLDFGASSGGLRVASILGNASGAASFGLGASDAQTLRVAISNDFQAANGALGARLSDGTAFYKGATDAQFPSTLGQKVMAQSLAVAIASDQSALNINNISGTVSLPTGAATETTLAAINTKLVTEALDFGASSGGLRVASLIGNAAGAADFNTGAAGAQTLRVVLASGQTLASKIIGDSYVTSTRTVHSSTNVTTGAWVELVSSTSAAVNTLTIFSSSGSTLEIGTGASSSETRVLLVPPGGFDAPVKLNIPVSTRVSVRAVDVNATSGELQINYLG